MGRDRQLTISALDVGPTLELLSLPDSADSAQEFRDRSTGLPLNFEMVKRARELEMLYMGELKVLEDSDRDTCIAEMGRPPIPTCCVEIDKWRFDQARLQEQAGLSGDVRAVNNWCGRLGSKVCRNSPVQGSLTAGELDDDMPEVTGRRR